MKVVFELDIDQLGTMSEVVARLVEMLRSTVALVPANFDAIGMRKLVATGVTTPLELQNPDRGPGEEGARIWGRVKFVDEAFDTSVTLPLESRDYIIGDHKNLEKHVKEQYNAARNAVEEKEAENRPN